MDSNDELKEVDIKNRTCYYFDDIMRVVDIDFYKIFIRFDKIDGFIKNYNGTRYLALFGPERYNALVKKGVLHILLIIILQKSK